MADHTNREKLQDTGCVTSSQLGNLIRKSSQSTLLIPAPLLAGYRYLAHAANLLSGLHLNSSTKSLREGHSCADRDERTAEMGGLQED